MAPPRIDPLLFCALAAASGCALALDPWAAACGALGVLAVLAWQAWRFLRRGVDRAAGARFVRVAALALGLFALNAWRSTHALGAASARYAATLETLPAPARCVFRALVATSPVVLENGAPGRGAERAPAASAPEPVTADASTGRARVDVDVLDGVCALAPRPDPGAAHAHAAESAPDPEPASDRELPLAPPLRIRLYAAPDDLVRGDEVEVLAQIAPVHLFWNAGLSDPRSAIHLGEVTASGTVLDAERLARGAGLAAIVDRWRAAVRRRIEATFAPSTNPLARALVLGETDLTAEDSEAFRASGLSHLLAVSGTHLVLVVAALGRALRALATRIPALAARFDVGRAAAFACVPLAWLYADFAGGSGSARRAAAMMTVAMLARALGRRSHGVRAFAWSLGGAALYDPLAMCDASFALSVGATAGLLVGARVGRDWFTRTPRPLAVLGRIFAATLFATLGCAPFMLSIAPGIPLLSLAANVLAAPFGELAALPLCLVHALVSWWPAAEAGTALVAGGALHAVRAVAEAAASGPAVPLPPPTGAELAALAVALAAFFVAGTRARRAVAVAGAFALLMLELTARHDTRSEGLLRVTALDVGQGDSLLVDLPDGRVMLIDGGGFVGSPVDVGLRVLLPLLRSRRRARIDIAVLSHPHPDHYGGLLTALDAVPVGELWHNGMVAPRAAADPASGEAHGRSELPALFARLAARGTRLRAPADLCGAPSLFGEAAVTVLSPCPGPDPDLGANDNSLVLRIELGARAALLVGDAEREREERLLASVPRAALRADLLKVGHHGSRTSSSPELLAAVEPRFAFISCGVRNRFGHPYPTTLGALERAGIAVLRTDRGGSITWETDGDAVRVHQVGSVVDAEGAVPP